MGAGGLCREKKQEINCSLWIDVDSPTFVFPEMQSESYGEKSDLGIAFSGGALRSAVATLGYLRALHSMNILQRASYIVSNSGATWTHTPFAFLQSDEQIMEFLGTYIPPVECTLENMTNKHKGHTECLAKSYHLEMVKNGVTCLTGSGWNEQVSETFFKKYDLHHTNIIPSAPTKSRTTPQQSQVEVTSARAPFTSPREPFRNVPYNTSMPFPIFSGSFPLHNDTLPMEMTPLYHGFPCRREVTGGKLIGGYLTDPMSFRSEVDGGEIGEILESIAATREAKTRSGNAVPPSAPLQLRVSAVVNPLTVSEMASMSSTVVSGFLTSILAKCDPSDTQVSELFGGDVYWQPYENGFDDHLTLSDGGFFDNNAVISLLRRGVKNIIACYMNEYDLKKDFEVAPSLPSLFGCNTQGWMGVDKDQFAKIKQVFPKKDFAKVKSALLSQLKAGEPTRYLLTTEVLPNRHSGVTGGYTVQILFIALSLPRRWLQQVPEDMRSRVERGQERCLLENVEAAGVSLLGLDNDLDGFPYFSSTQLNYSDESVNTLANMCCWSMLDAQDVIFENLIARGV
jgi:hypothetical protein